MCGIFGAFGPDIQLNRSVAGDVARLLHHRGPNDEGFESGSGWALGFRRLSILDLSPLGHQPMRTTDGRYWIAFNGEVYNFVELRDELRREGESFVGGSDTEVLLRVLARRGPQALAQLNGMFAIALVDTQARTFLLARDRLGVKPLYYASSRGELRFASELKALLGWPGKRPDIDRDSIAEYLAMGYLSSESCVFAGHSKLPPGHFMVGSLDDPAAARIARYWDVAISDCKDQRAVTATELDELQALLQDAVRIRLRSDVPVGVFLSGGVDSGLIAALAAQVSGDRPLGLTVGFAEESADETELARATARHVGLEHRILTQQAKQLSMLDRVAWFYDEPFGDPSIMPTFALCEAAAQHATVFLSGDGGDEAFAGYRHYIECMRHRLLLEVGSAAAPGLRYLAGFAPELSMLRYRLLKISRSDLGSAPIFDAAPDDPAIWFVAHPDLRARAFRAERPIWTRWARSRGGSLTARQQRFDYDLYLPDDILVKVDRASMAHSIEVRSPLLDYRLVEWAGRLPRSALLNTTTGKLPLRALAARLLPAVVAQGGKKGFGAPLDDWFRQPDAAYFARERLLSLEARSLGYWDTTRVEELIRIHQSSEGRSFGLLLWRLLMLEAWARHFAGAEASQSAPASQPASA